MQFQTCKLIPHFEYFVSSQDTTKSPHYLAISSPQKAAERTASKASWSMRSVRSTDSTEGFGDGVHKVLYI